MRLILKQRVDGLGSLGDVVDVKPGYGRNYLLPFDKALVATKQNLAVFAKQRADLEAKESGRLSDAQQRAERVGQLSLTIPMKASDEGRLFGSVGLNEIIAAAKAQSVDLTKKEIKMPHGVLRQIGEYELLVRLHTDVETQLKVIIEKEASA